MTRVTISNGVADPHIGPDSHVGFRMGAGEKGWVQRIGYQNGAWRLLSLDDGDLGNGFGGEYTRYEAVLDWLGDSRQAVYSFSTSKDLFRWLGSNQPDNV